jgi:tRNA-dihydrouridine synthase C
VKNLTPLSPLLLAPMEGLLDHLLREQLTPLAPYSMAVSEFIRVTDRVLPKRVFTRIVPELLTGGRTQAGVPVWPQLLGSDPSVLADNAARLAELAPPGIDLNFGCPARCVNRHRGGAVLLDEPELLHRIVAAVRRAVPQSIAVTAKMRLGVQDRGRMLEAAQALAAGGAAQLVVHARTQRDGYKPPAHWHELARIRAALPDLPLVANGEIWTLQDALQARRESGVQALMLGRGAVADPWLAARIQAHDAGLDSPRAGWPELAPALLGYWRRVRQAVQPKHQAGRVKQWLHYLRRAHPQAEAAYQGLRTEANPAQFDGLLRALLREHALLV